MTKRFFSRAVEDPLRPEARAICMRCGMIYNRADLRPQLRQSPGTLTPTQLYVCYSCYDDPAPFMRTVWFPVDPPNISFPSPEFYTIDEHGSYPPAPTPGVQYMLGGLPLGGAPLGGNS
jgi:hypothetical protein